jgi:hypothetical protein
MRTTLNRTFGVSAAAIVVLTLTCCARQPEQAQHTVAEYRANVALRREQFARCTNDPGTLGETPDCVNARQAQRLEEIGSVRDTPPIQLPRPGSKK